MMKNWLITLLFGMPMLCACGGGEELDPNAAPPNVTPAGNWTPISLLKTGQVLTTGQIDHGAGNILANGTVIPLQHNVLDQGLLYIDALDPSVSDYRFAYSPTDGANLPTGTVTYSGTAAIRATSDTHSYIVQMNANATADFGAANTLDLALTNVATGGTVISST
ncbi:MAG: hypothetical protein ACPGVK_01345, partial [Halocynthiibacter sp.]